MEHVVRKNINRGYMKLTVWQDAKALYVMTCKMFRAFPYEFKRMPRNRSLRWILCIGILPRDTRADPSMSISNFLTSHWDQSVSQFLGYSCTSMLGSFRRPTLTWRMLSHSNWRTV